MQKNKINESNIEIKSLECLEIQWSFLDQSEEGKYLDETIENAILVNDMTHKSKALKCTELYWNEKNELAVAQEETSCHIDQHSRKDLLEKVLPGSQKINN